MTAPTLYLIDDDGNLATYAGPLGVRVEADAVIIATQGDTEYEYPCADGAEALALRDVIAAAIVRAAQQARPCCVVDMRDPDGSKAREQAEAAKRERIERDRIALGRPQGFVDLGRKIEEDARASAIIVGHRTGG